MPWDRCSLWACFSINWERAPILSPRIGFLSFIASSLAPASFVLRCAFMARYDAAILLECDSVERTGLRGLEDLFLINIDHHVTGREFASLNWIDRHAVSAGAMVYRLALAAGAEITPEMASCLYTTLLTDTGAFCYGAVNESTFALARELRSRRSRSARHRSRGLLFRACRKAFVAGRCASQIEA